MPLDKPQFCTNCVLYGSGNGYVPASGSGANGILLVGEAAGETEAMVGRPFVGAAGFYLDRVLKRAALPRDDFRVHNVLSCQPPNNWLSGAPYETEAITKCGRLLDDTIIAMKPKVTVALGNIALRRLTNHNGIQRYRGRAINTPFGWVVPTYHPSFLLPRAGQANTSRFVGAVIKDLRFAERIAREGFSRATPNYLEDPKVDEFLSFIREFETAWEQNHNLFYLAWDIETPYKIKTRDEDELSDDAEVDDDVQGGPKPPPEPILRISFCFRKGYALSVPWTGPYLEGIRRLLSHPCQKAVWNGSRFDVPIVEAEGFKVAGEIYDFMWGWHVLQSDLPKGLEFVSSFYTDTLPWKHEADARLAWYSAVDADVTFQCAVGLTHDLVEKGQWRAFLSHVVELDPILLAMGNEGVHIDRSAQDALRLTLEQQEASLVQTAQTIIPDSVLPTQHYKRYPGDGDGRRFRAVVLAGAAKFCTACGAQVSNKTDHQKGKVNPCRAAKATLEVRPADVTEWDELLPFNPNSIKDMTSYIVWRKHPMGTHYKTKQPTVDKKHLEKLTKKYPADAMYQIAITLRGVKKTLGTYVNGFAPDEHGKIYTTYSHAPSTGRLSSRNVNLQNVSHRANTPYAKEVRRTIIPGPGHVFVEADSSAIEAVMTGYFMGSAEYVALAKKGIHDFLNCFEHDLAFDDAGIARSKREFSTSRDRNKIVVHGTSYGMTPYLMHMNWPDIFPKLADAEAAQARFFAACPGLADWQHATRRLAHKQTYLTNPWGYRHYFYSVYGKTKDGAPTLGEDAKRAIAFLPQSSAGAFMKDNAKLLAKTKFWPMPANGLVHDSYCLRVKPTDINEAIDTLRAVLTRAIPEMDGLTIGCDVKIGRENWCDMEPVAA